MEISNLRPLLAWSCPARSFWTSHRPHSRQEPLLSCWFWSASGDLGFDSPICFLYGFWQVERSPTVWISDCISELATDVPTTWLHQWNHRISLRCHGVCMCDSSRTGFDCSNRTSAQARRQSVPTAGHGRSSLFSSILTWGTCCHRLTCGSICPRPMDAYLGFLARLGSTLFPWWLLW